MGPWRLGTCDAHDHLQPIAITRQGIQQAPDLRNRVNKDCEIWPKISSRITAKIKTCFQGHRMNYLLHLWELKNNAMPLGPRLASPYPLPSEVWICGSVYKSPTPVTTISESLFTYFRLTYAYYYLMKSIKWIWIQRAYQFSYIWNFEPDIGNSFGEILFKSRKFTKNVWAH